MELAYVCECSGNSGHSRSLTDSENAVYLRRRRSAIAGPLPSKLVMRVRFPEPRARCVPDGLAALPGFPVLAASSSASSPSVSAGKDVPAAFGQRTAQGAAQPP
jgi:hypothetical protein